MVLTRTPFRTAFCPSLPCTPVTHKANGGTLGTWVYSTVK